MPRKICGFKSLLACLAVLFSAAGTAFATFPGHNGLIAFQAQTAAGVQIYTVRPNGKDLQQITFLSGDAVAPAWSPNGRRIVFEHDAPGECANVALMNADGNGLIEFPAPGVCEDDPSFTPGGKRIIFHRFDPATNDDAFWIMELNGDNRHRIGQSGFDPNVSPNGKKISFLCCTNGNPDASALFTSNVDGSNLFQVTPFSFDVAVKQDWAPDGKHLVFTIYGDVPIDGVSPNIVTIQPDGTHFRQITHYQGGDVKATVGSYSPNGRWIVFRLTDHDTFGLYKIHPDGTHLKAILPLSDFRPSFIAWGPRVCDDDWDDTWDDAQD